jgi:hypothetical protein
MGFFVSAVLGNNRGARHLDSSARRAQEHPIGKTSPPFLGRSTARSAPYAAGRFLQEAAGRAGHSEIAQNVWFNSLIRQPMAATIAYPQWAFRWCMIRSGSYSVWFRTLRGEGTGIVELADGKVTGGDTVFGYTGTYFETDDEFLAYVSTRRHTQGHPSVFGIDEFDLTLIGKSMITTASCTGRPRQLPDLAFEAVFIRIEDRPSGVPARSRFIQSKIKEPAA